MTGLTGNGKTSLQPLHKALGRMDDFSLLFFFFFLLGQIYLELTSVANLPLSLFFSSPKPQCIVVFSSRSF